MGILPRTNPEQRARFYEDVETILSAGFLTHSINVKDTRFSIRSLCPGDMFLLRARTTGLSEAEWQMWMVASSIWMVNGYNLLEDANAPFRIYDTLLKLPRVAKFMLFGQILGLFARQNKAVSAVEPYCYESASRFRWKSAGRLGDTPTFKIPGAERLGISFAMQMWRFFNEIEDQRVQDEAMWEGFKLTASSNAPKGVKKIDQHDKSRRENEHNRRQDVMDRFYYSQMGMISDDPAEKSKKETFALQSKSPDDLANEMYRWVAGEEDWHDRVVSDYKNRITERYETERKERELRRQALRQRYEEQEKQMGPSVLVGYTPDQLATILQGRVPGVKEVYHDTTRTQERLFQKHLQVADRGVLQAQQGFIAAPESDPKLMELITQRQVPYHVGEED